jgi:hypothetical protein
MMENVMKHRGRRDRVEVYQIQHYVIAYVSDMRQVGEFLRVLQFPQQ